MGEGWKQLFSEYPVLQASIICKDVITNLNGQRTYHQELLKIQQSGIEQFILVHVWRGTNTAQTTLYEVIHLTGPDGEIISRTACDPFQVYGPSYRHYNYFAYTHFVFPKQGIYEFHSQLFKENEKETPCLHMNCISVIHNVV